MLTYALYTYIYMLLLPCLGVHSVVNCLLLLRQCRVTLVPMLQLLQLSLLLYWYKSTNTDTLRSLRCFAASSSDIGALSTTCVLVKQVLWYQ